MAPSEIDFVIRDGEFYGLAHEKEERERKKKIAEFYDSGFI